MNALFSHARQHPRRTVALAVIAAGIPLGVVSVSDSGPAVAGLLAGLLVVSYTLRLSLGHFLGLLAGWLPFVGRFVLLDAGSLPDITVERIALLVAIVLCGERVWRQRRHTVVKADRLMMMALGVGLATPLLMLSALRSPDVANAVRVFLDSYLLPSAIFLMCAAVLWSEREITGFMRFAMAGVLAWTGVAGFEMATGVSVFAGIDYSALGRDYVRAAGPLLSPPALGWATSVFATAGTAWILGARRTFAGVFGVAAAFGASAMSLTRSAWLGAGLGVMAVIGRLGGRSRWRFVILGVLGAGISVMVLWHLGAQTVAERAGNEGTINNRLIMLATSWVLIRRSPFFGIGLASYADASRPVLTTFGELSASYGTGVLAPHNTIVLVAVEAGLLTALFLIVAGYHLVREVLTRAFVKGRDNWPAMGLLGGLAATITNAVAVDLQLMWRAAYVVAMLLGVMYGAMTSHARADGGISSLSGVHGSLDSWDPA